MKESTFNMSFYLDAAFVMLLICTFCDLHVGIFAHSQWLSSFMARKASNFVLVFDKFADGFAHINFNCKDGLKFAKKFANLQTSTFLSVEDSSKFHGNIKKFVISLWMHMLFFSRQNKRTLYSFCKKIVFPQM